jgi:hypothetical protein
MRFLVFLAVACWGCGSQQQPRLSICAIFKNEAPWLKEWLVYHRDVLQVDHFYLYNNDSSDHYREVLEPFIQEGVVELFEWSSADPAHCMEGPGMDAPWSAAQLGAYNDCLKKRALGRTDWVAMIDIDEFIVPVRGVSSFYALLRRAAEQKKGTVTLAWRIFGTSDVEDLQEGELLTEKLTWRGEEGHPWHQQVKSIHRPEGVSFCAIHTAVVMEPHFGSRSLPAEEVRIHHYWTRTGRYCAEKRKMSTESHPQFFADLHQVEDWTIAQYLPLLEQRMRGL